VSELVHIRRAGGREFWIVGAVILKLQASNKVWTNDTESRLVFDKVRERVE